MEPPPAEPPPAEPPPAERLPAEPPPAERLPAEPSRAELRRRLDEVFGEALPTVTGDERDESEPGGVGDDELLANRPPHHE